MAFHILTDQEIEGKHITTFDELKTPQDTHSKIFADRANQTLAADKELGYSLQKLLQITHNETDAHLFHSPAEALLSKFGKTETVKRYQIVSVYSIGKRTSRFYLIFSSSHWR
jgi:hypothetical protein